jgi:hypothetical protein
MNMQKFHIHIPAKTNEELIAALEESAFLLTGLSEAINDFDTNFGSEAAKRKNLWKKKADKWKEKYKIIENE